MNGIKSERITDIRQFLKIHTKYVNTKETWIFRGHQEGHWKLETKLEREIRSFGLPMRRAFEFEGGLLRRFKRQSHNYLEHIPAPGNYMEWFALMQQYGAPTRLLDWTYSFFVAAYFAVERASGECAIWAFNAECMDDKLVHILSPDQFETIDPRSARSDVNLRSYEDFEAVFVKPKKLFVVPMNPYKFNERLIIQQGVFLCPGDIRKPFEENLGGPFSRAELRANLRKYVIKNNRALRKDILYNLHRMNMNRATLFPGLQGFAESLSTLLAFPDPMRAFPCESDTAKRRMWNRCHMW